MISRCLPLALILLAACAASPGVSDASGPPPDQGSADQKSVLILLTGQPGLPAASAVAAGIRSELVSVWSTRVAIETEHVDVARFKGTDYEHHLRALYRFKYAGRLWEQYRWHITVTTLIVVAAQASLIVGLLIERQRRRRAQAGLSERLAFETLVASISGTFAGLPTGRVDEHIRDCLRRTVLFIGADRGTLWQPSADGQALSATHSWAAEGTSPAPATIPMSAFRILWPLSQQGQPLSFTSLDELPPEVLAERRVFETLGVKSFLALPLRIGDRTLGTLAFSNLRVERPWPAELVQRLQTLAELCANALHFDISARKRAEAEARRHLDQIAHMDRVAALGELASSLAHELNQPLTAILTNAQAAQRFLAATPADLDELRECLEDIVKNDRRAGEVIRRMRRLLKKGGPAELLPLHLNDLVQNVLALVANDALLRQVSIETVPAPGLPAVYGDGVQIQQVILNLLVNAIAAAATGPPADRKVTVSTAAGDTHVDLSVHDSGKGISETDLDRVFEPFFTTKHEGLGMGLAISRSIVQAHQGRIWGENDPAGGATFRVRLPAEGGAAVRAVSGR